MRAAAAILLAALAALPARADDVEASIEAALEAYRAGDIRTAKEELDFAGQLLGQMKAEGLRAFLPEPLEGWEREDAETDTQAMAAFGGGQMASARYTSGDADLEIQLMADNQMVAAMAGMFSSAALMGAMGEVRRIEGEKVVIAPEGDLQAMIDNRIMVQITGSADADTKAAYFEAIDLEGLKDF
jgi:hypothetical protein